ncbi:hypothetical protein BpHYR1_000269 [Brachionus plicatilis]|uniref:Uncharacterized protein n=1 Tax=Brachionus plicatilis TaxID=10195 RepID=A0A3M7QF59_BRAPC|nr:hypothetical protein BpHYR1_000269 [Brachionus plicatilis]
MVSTSTIDTSQWKNMYKNQLSAIVAQNQVILQNIVKDKFDVHSAPETMNTVPCAKEKEAQLQY